MANQPYRRLPIAIILLMIILGRVEAGERPPGMRVDVGGYKLHIHCLGSGQPAVLLDAGLGGSSWDWDRVQTGLATTTRTCVYDRAGYGWSDSGPLPRSSSRIVAELHALLEGAAIPPPYILVGHSFGGYNMRLYASRYPAETAGLVLVDTPHEAQMDSLLQNQIMRQIDPHGVLQSLWPQVLTDLATVDLEPIAYLLGWPSKTLRAILGELAAFQHSGKELNMARLQPELPLVVITHGRRVLPEGPLGEQLEQQWLELQRDLTTRHKNSTFLIAKDSAHAIPRDQPELIIEAIRRLIVVNDPKDSKELVQSPSYRSSTLDAKPERMAESE
jgi:pimeloyl-ACP methyl ester carboxylesterase